LTSDHHCWLTSQPALITGSRKPKSKIHIETFCRTQKADVDIYHRDNTCCVAANNAETGGITMPESLASDKKN
jgi:hypothetical protein